MPGLPLLHGLYDPLKLGEQGRGWWISKVMRMVLECAIYCILFLLVARQGRTRTLWTTDRWDVYMAFKQTYWPLTQWILPWTLVSVYDVNGAQQVLEAGSWSAEGVISSRDHEQWTFHGPSLTSINFFFPDLNFVDLLLCWHQYYTSSSYFQILLTITFSNHPCIHFFSFFHTSSTLHIMIY